jgi:hypothetical protein
MMGWEVESDVVVEVKVGTMEVGGIRVDGYVVDSMSVGEGGYKKLGRIVEKEVESDGETTIIVLQSSLIKQTCHQIPQN